MTRAFNVACASLGCHACPGNADCPSLDAYRRKYGDKANAEAKGDLDMWFPRAETEHVLDAPQTTEEAHDRLAHGGYAAGQAREAEKAAQYRPRIPEWVRRKINAEKNRQPE